MYTFICGTLDVGSEQVHMGNILGIDAIVIWLRGHRWPWLLSKVTPRLYNTISGIPQRNQS